MYDVIMTTSSTSLREAIKDLVIEVNLKKEEGWHTVGGVSTNPIIPLYPEDLKMPSFYYACQAIEKG